MHQPTHHFITLIAIVVAGCQPVSGKSECVGAIDSMVRNGEVTQQHPSVGMLRLGRWICTGTLIAPNKVLTAMHCIEGVRVEDVEFRLENAQGDRTHSVQAIAFTESENYGSPAATRLEDIALVHLERNILDVEYMPVSSEPVRVGETLTLVGYGETAENRGNSGTKRTGEYEVQYISAGSFSASGDQGSCSGDSGGPVLRETATGFEQVGITSAGGCQSNSLVGRVDVFSEFIATEVAPIIDEPSEELCSDDCHWAADGECDDGGAGSDYSVCEFGSDCVDCGERPVADAPPDQPFDSAVCGM